MRRSLLGGVLALGASAAGAATIAPDALLCESAESITFVRQTMLLSNKPAPEVLKQAQAQIDFSRIQTDTARLMPQLKRDAEKMAAGLPPYQAVVTGCMAAPSGATATVVERRPISGIARVRVTINGSPAEVFVESKSVVD